MLSDSAGFSVFLVDCLTLWMNNLMFRAQEEGGTFSEEDAIEECRELLDASSKANGTVVFVTNEVGSGIVPENATARLFRDVVGRCNQTVAQAAAEVYLVASGLPITLKKGNS